MRILLIDDNKRLCESLQYQLECSGYTVDISHDGEDGLYLILEQAYDLILLDRMLPTISGINILKKVRKAGICTPILLLTALSELSDKILGLDEGADDYIVKPFEFEELEARIRCAIRRPSKLQFTKQLSFGDLMYDCMSKEISTYTHSLNISQREGNLIEFFLRNPNQVLPRALILARVWGPDANVEEGNLENYIHFLRNHLKAIHSHVCISTIRGIGYRMEKRND